MNFKKLIGLVLVPCISVLAFSGCATGAATDASAGAGMGSSLIMMVAMVAIFYFLLIRPENKRKKKAQEMRDSISVGNKITTIGGIIGKSSMWLMTGSLLKPARIGSVWKLPNGRFPATRDAARIRRPPIPRRPSRSN